MTFVLISGCMMCSTVAHSDNYRRRRSTIKHKRERLRNSVCEREREERVCTIYVIHHTGLPGNRKSKLSSQQESISEIILVEKKSTDSVN